MSHHPGPTPHPELDPDRIVQVATDHRVDPWWHRGREQYGLAILGDVAEDRLDVLGEPHVQHLVRLIQHHHLQAPQTKRLAGDVVDGPSRCRDHYINPPFQRP